MEVKKLQLQSWNTRYCNSWLTLYRDVQKKNSELTEGCSTCKKRSKMQRKYNYLAYIHWLHVYGTNFCVNISELDFPQNKTWDFILRIWLIFTYRITSRMVVHLAATCTILIFWSARMINCKVVQVRQFVLSILECSISFELSWYRNAWTRIRDVTVFP